jgi:hypothetical protein
MRKLSVKPLKQAYKKYLIIIQFCSIFNFMNVAETTPSQYLKSVFERVYAPTVVAVTTMVLANTVDRNLLVVHANDPLSKQAGLALPSALPAPSLGDYGRSVNVGTQIATTVVSFEAARSTSSPAELAGTALAAQVASCGADAAVERTGWLTQAERAQEDVGFSAISTAWFTKFLLDRAQRSTDNGRLWLTSAGVFAGTVVIGLPIYEGSQGGKLDAVSHSAGLAVGIIAHKLSRRRAGTLDSST